MTDGMAGNINLVTGEAGFISSHLVDSLLQAGQHVIGLDNLSLGSLDNLRLALAHARFQFLEADLNDVKRCEQLLESAVPSPIETIWHFAANSDIAAGAVDPEVDLRNTFMSTFQALALARCFGIRKFAFASSSAIYGAHADALTEETGPLLPISNYGAMKLASEAIISAALETHLLQAWIFRFPNVVGPRATHGVIHDFIEKLRRNPSELTVLGDGRQEKPYLHVRELVEAMFFIYHRANEQMNCFNIAPSGGSTTVREIAESVVAVFAPVAAIRYTGGEKGWPGDVPRFSYDIAKLTALGWRSRWSSAEAVLRAIRESAEELA